MRDIDLIVIHCSATAIDKPYTVEQLGDDHEKRGIRRPAGYHRYIRRDGTIHKLRNYIEVGAHVYGYNSHSIGICYEGGIIPGGRANNPDHAKDTRTESQKHSLLLVLKDIYDTVGDYQDMRPVKIVGHRDLSPDIDGDGVIEQWEYLKMCPCFDAIPEYKDFNTNFDDSLL